MCVAASFPGLEVLGGETGEVKPLVNILSSSNGCDTLEEGRDGGIWRSSQSFMLLFGVAEEGSLEAFSSLVYSLRFS